MKKIAVFTLLLVSLLSAGWIRTMGASEAPRAPSIITYRSDTTGVYIRVALPGFSEKDTTVDYENYKRITIPEEPIDWDTANVGKPQLPYVRLRIAVPDSADFKITVRVADHRLFQDYVLYPVPEIVFEDSSGWMSAKEEFTQDEAFYQRDTLYPGYFYQINSDGYWRNQRVLELSLFPIQCNPGHEVTYVYPELYLNIDYKGTVIENTLGLGPFEDIGREELLNYAGIDTAMQPESQIEPAVRYYTDLQNGENVADYLIVTHEDFLADSTDSSWIQQFAQWRVDHNAFNVAVVKMCDIYDQFLVHPPTEDDSAQALRNFLIYAFVHWLAPSISDNHFAYCLFIGDWKYVPTDTIYYMTGGKNYLVPIEGYFRDLTGEPGGFDDIMLGRWPVNILGSPGNSELMTIAEKTIDYEQSPELGEWRRRGLIIGGSGYFDPEVNVALPYFTDIAYDTFTVRWYKMLQELAYDTVAADAQFKDSVRKYFNLGEIMTVFYDHGGPLGWSPDFGVHNYAPSLSNGSKLPVVLSYACTCADFLLDHPYYDTPQGDSIAHGYDSCFAECLLLNQNGGAVAFYGGAAPIYLAGYNAIPIERMLRKQQWILGKTIIKMAGGPPSDHKYYCLIGDPALDVGDYTAIPDMPDLVIRPRGIDTVFSDPLPYPMNGDLIPVQMAVWNIGAEPAYNAEVKVRLKVPLFDDTATVTTFAISEIGPRDSVVAQFMWDPTVYHLDNGPTVVLPDDFEGEIGEAHFEFVVDPDDEIVETWEYNNRSSCTMPNPLYLYPGRAKALLPPICQPCIADLQHDEQPEIIVADGADSIYVMDAGGNIHEGWPQYFERVRGLAVADINGDDSLDVVAMTRDSIVVFDCSGNFLNSGWPVQIPYNGFFIDSPLPSMGDINSDGFLDIIVVIGDRVYPFDMTKILVYDYQGSLEYNFNLSTSGLVSSVPAISDINGDGSREIVISYQSGENPPRTEVFNRYGYVDSIPLGNNMMTPALADINDDNIADAIIGGHTGLISGYDFAHETVLWQTQTNGGIRSSPAVGEVNTEPGFDNDEVAMGNDAGQFYALRAVDGTPWSPWPLVLSGTIRTSPAIAYLDTLTNGLEIVIGSHDQYIHTLTFEREAVEPFPLPVFGQLSSPLVGDVDGNGKSETILSSSDGYLHIWQNRGSSVPAHTLEWPQFHHDYQRTGVYGWIGGISGSKVIPGEITHIQPTTIISMYVEEEGLYTELDVYDSEGNEVRTLLNQSLSAESHHVVWDGTDDYSNPLHNGVYFVRIKVGDDTHIMPLVIDR